MIAEMTRDNLNQEAPECRYVRKHYGVPANLGRRVVVGGRTGIITSDCGHYIGVNFDDDKPGIVRQVHPLDAEYGEMGKARPLTRSQRTYLRYLEVAECFDSFRHFLDYEASKRHENIGKTLIKEGLLHG